GEQATDLKHEVRGEQDGYDEVEAPFDDARWSVAEAKHALAALRDAAQQLERAEIRANEAQELEAAARQEAEAQREAAARLEAEAWREQSARREAEVQSEEAVRHIAEARQELATLRAAGS